MKNFFRHLWGPKPPPPRRPAEPPSTKEFRPTPPIRVQAGSTRLEVGVVTEVGTVREHNEDNYYVPGRPSVNSGHPGNGDGPVFAGPSDLFVVADGMGGQAAGEEAKTAFRAQADKWAADLDLIRREEFEALKAEIASLRAEIATLKNGEQA